MSNNILPDDIIKLSNGEEEYRCERYAVVIGVGQYNNHPNPEHLPNMENNAEKLKKLLTNQGNFTVNTLITEKNKTNPTKSNIVEALDMASYMSNKFRNSLKTFIFYFSGHGAYYNNIDNGTNFIYPMDANINRIQKVKDTCISLEWLFDKIKNISDNIKNKHGKSKVLVIIDACRKENTMMGEHEQIINPDNKDLSIIYSARHGEPAYTLPEDEYSVFTKFLVDKIEQGTNLIDCYSYLEDYMANWSHSNDKGYNQFPQFSKNDIAKIINFVITIKPEPEPEPEPEPIENIRTELKQAIQKGYTENTFQELVFEMGYNYAGIPGGVFNNKIIGFIERVEAEGKLQELYDKVKKDRPHLFDNNTNNKNDGHNTNTKNTPFTVKNIRTELKQLALNELQALVTDTDLMNEINYDSKTKANLMNEIIRHYRNTKKIREQVDQFIIRLNNEE